MPSFQIVIPMSGFGERFRRAGYAVPKPLIEIEGKRIIAHVVDMFPGDSDFLLICNEDHLVDPDYRMAEILKTYCPNGRVVGIPVHRLGPVHAVRQVEHMIDPCRLIFLAEPTNLMTFYNESGLVSRQAASVDAFFERARRIFIPFFDCCAVAICLTPRLCNLAFPRSHSSAR